MDQLDIAITCAVLFEAYCADRLRQGCTRNVLYTREAFLVYMRQGIRTGRFDAQRRPGHL